MIVRNIGHAVADRRCRRLRAVLGRSALAGALLGVGAVVQAADCPPLREPRIPAIPGPVDPINPVNIDKVKTQLNEYHGGNYDYDVAAVLSDARVYVDRRLKEPFTRPAVVLDIDETSLSNWPNLKAVDFGLLRDIPCEPTAIERPCSFNNWVLLAQAPAIPWTRDFFNHVIAKGVAVFFVTGRRDSQRAKTIENLERSEFKGWTKLVTRPDGDKDETIVPFKSGARAEIQAKDKDTGYTIIANIGDQRSDLEGGHAECSFKVPNPFYFIP
jgi:HAD superfamily, subfamily IIIB (Acid phosphatase)